MRLFDTDKMNEVWSTISRNKVRSILTGFGVFWGLFMLIVLISVGSGFRNGISGIVSSFTINSVEFWTYKTSEPYKGYKSGRWWRMDNRDIELIRQKCPSVEYIVPMIFGYSNQGVVRGTKTGTFRYFGTNADYFKIEKISVFAGRLLRETDNEAKRKVCVIGMEVYQTMFEPGEDPIGQYIRIDGIYFQVVGLVGRPGSASGGMNIEDRIVLPLQTMQNVYGRGITFNNLMCSTKKGYSASAMQQEVETIIKQAHDISPTDPKALRGWNVEEQFQKFNNVIVGISILTWIVGLGALFSGVIGISNIMLVSIRERMREIGVRRALGAKPAAIMGQIISESFVLTAIAGLVGFLFGMGVVAMLEAATANPSGNGIPFQPGITFGMAVGCLMILIGAGILSGILPAYRALKIKAIDAIRDE
ncbi:MAG: ABC transporter permease [Rikenellaceae bacterium]|nr:ABC transporter permease [Rikenellaceae bacterium]